MPSSNSAEALAAAAAAGVRATGILVEPDPVGLAGLVRLVEAGQLTVLVSKTFPLTEVAAAHDAAEHGHSRGKIVLTV